MAWGKVKFFYKNSLTGLTVTSAATGFPVANVLDMLEGTLWKATSTSDQYIAFDAGVGNTYTADYVAIGGHNLNTAGATLTLQYSTNGSAWSDAFTAYAVANNKAIGKEFITQTVRYWRVKLSGMTATPQIAICIWGQAVELDWASSSFDPYAEDNKANINLSETGYVLGIHNRYTERQFDLVFSDADDTLYQKCKTWWDTSGLKNFFVAWEPTSHATDVYLMRPDSSFKNPLQIGGLYRNITINLKGRKE